MPARRQGINPVTIPAMRADKPKLVIARLAVCNVNHVTVLIGDLKDETVEPPMTVVHEKVFVEALQHLFPAGEVVQLKEHTAKQLRPSLTDQLLALAGREPEKAGTFYEIWCSRSGRGMDYLSGNPYPFSSDRDRAFAFGTIQDAATIVANNPELFAGARVTLHRHVPIS